MLVNLELRLADHRQILQVEKGRSWLVVVRPIEKMF